MMTLSWMITELRVLVLAGNFDWLATLLQTASSNTSAEGINNSNITVVSTAKDIIQVGLLGSAGIISYNNCTDSQTYNNCTFMQWSSQWLLFCQPFSVWCL